MSCAKSGEEIEYLSVFVSLSLHSLLSVCVSKVVNTTILLFVKGTTIW